MNYLVHLYLSDPDPLCRLGNLMGDFIKGPLGDHWPPPIGRGLRQHRRIDAFAQRHQAFHRSKGRIDPAFGHCRGILVDVFYDHLLARSWDDHADLPLEEFAAAVYRTLEANFNLLPPALQKVAPRMIGHDWLVSYREPSNVARALERLGQRLSRPNLLAGGLPELLTNLPGLSQDCEAFLTDARTHLQTQPLI